MKFLIAIGSKFIMKSPVTTRIIFLAAIWAPTWRANRYYWERKRMNVSAKLM
jgi:hypothetical protein